MNGSSSMTSLRKKLTHKHGFSPEKAVLGAGHSTCPFGLGNWMSQPHNVPRKFRESRPKRRQMPRGGAPFAGVEYAMVCRKYWISLQKRGNFVQPGNEKPAKCPCLRCPAAPRQRRAAVPRYALAGPPRNGVCLPSSETPYARSVLIGHVTCAGGTWMTIDATTVAQTRGGANWPTARSNHACRPLNPGFMTVTSHCA